MTTKSLKLTYEWQQVSTGQEALLLQCISGRFALCQSIDTPPIEQPWHIFTEAVITPPSSVWVKTFTPDNILIITDMTKRVSQTLEGL